MINEKIESILTTRLTAALEHWMSIFDQEEVDSSDSFKSKRRRRLQSDEKKAAEVPIYPSADAILPAFMLEICVKNQVMYLDPPPESLRATWYSQLRDWIGTFSLNLASV